MPKIWKEIIRPGTYWYLDQETQAPRKLSVTPELVKHFGKTGTQMLGAGLSIPVPDEHQLDAKAMTKAERAAKQLKNNSGWVEKFGMKGDHLFAYLDITDPKTATKIKEGSIKWVSPWLNSFTDGDGRSWDGAISHVALTSRPRISKQAAFPDLAAAMSLAGRLIEEPVQTKRDGPTIITGMRGGLYLSLSNLLDADAGIWKPKFPNAFTLFSGSVRLAVMEDDVTGKKKPKKEGLGDGDIDGVEDEDGMDDVGGKKRQTDVEMSDDAESMEGEEKGGEKKPSPDGEITEITDLEDAAAEAPENGADFTKADACCDLLRMLGLDIPEGVNEESFVHEIYEAAKMKLHSMKAKKPGAEMSDNGNQPNSGRNDLPANPTVQEPPPMFMSLEQVNKIKDPDTKKIASALLSTNQAHEALCKRVVNEETARRQRRVERIAKSLPPSASVARDKLLAQAKNVKLSLDANGVVVDPLAETLDILEAGIVQLPAMLMSQDHGDEQPRPSFENGMNQDKVNAAADFLCPPVKKAN